jgi:acetylornithine deacetylase/succinyl-diaminopimelate desuccinylase-like protein
VQFNEITRAYFQRAAPLHPGRLGADLHAAAATPPDPRAIARLSRDPWYNAQMRTTCVATMLAGGHAPNALPQTARANVNCRRLPGVSAESVMAVLRQVIRDTSVVITVANASPQSPPSPLRADVEGAVRAASAAIKADLPIVPVMETGATDGLFFRNAGIPVYGVSGMAIDTDDIRAHGRDERVRADAFDRALEFTYRLLRALGGPAAR